MLRCVPLTVAGVVAFASAARGQTSAEVPALDAPAARTTLRAPNEVRVDVSIRARRLWVIAGDDTLRSATVAVPSGAVLTYGGRRWRFDAPEGRRIVRGKRVDPVWMPPDWHYAEVARDYKLRIKQLPPSGLALRDGRRLEVRDSVVGLVVEDSVFEALPTDEHIIFDSTLYIPPIATRNRRLSGELGRYALDIGDGFLLHGTPDPQSIGRAQTHGCIRLADEDIEWLYENIPVGAVVYVRD